MIGVCGEVSVRGLACGGAEGLAKPALNTMPPRNGRHRLHRLDKSEVSTSSRLCGMPAFQRTLAFSEGD